MLFVVSGLLAQCLPISVAAAAVDVMTCHHCIYNNKI